MRAIPVVEVLAQINHQTSSQRPRFEVWSTLPRFLCVVSLFITWPSNLHAQGQVLSLPGPFHFDGTNSVTMANSPGLAPTTQITITAWIKPDFSVPNVQDTILEKRDGCGSARAYELAIVKNYQNYAPGTIFFAASNASTDDLLSTVPVPNDNRYHHVAGTYDGATTKVFLDGVLVGQGVHTGLISTTSDPPVIGVNAGCGDASYADIGPIKVFDYSLSDRQIMSETAGFAVLTGPNTFTGNQTVSGTITATGFVGDGSGLTGISAAHAQTAQTADFAITAGDASTLGGNLPAAFAPAVGSASYVTKGGDTMTGTLNLPSNGLTVGGNQLAVAGGNIGIGTSTPDLGHAGPSYNTLDMENTTTGFGGTFIQLGHATTGNKARIVSDPNGLLLCSGCGGNATAAPLRFKAGEVTSATDSHLYLLPNGNFGIATVSASEKLEVAGNVKISGAGGKLIFPDGTSQQTAAGGSITGVTAGTGLSGGGTSGTVNVALSTTFTDSRYLALTGGALTGPLSAPSFSGSGSGLSNLNPANIAPGTAGINIGGTAANALNAQMLGGQVPGFYATTGSNTFGGLQTINGDASISGVITAGNLVDRGNLTIGGGTAITKHLSTTAVIAPIALKAGTCATTTFALPGVRDSDTLALGVSASLMGATGIPYYAALVPAPDTIAIRSCNLDPNINQKTGGTGTIRVDVWQH